MKLLRRSVGRPLVTGWLLSVPTLRKRQQKKRRVREMSRLSVEDPLCSLLRVRIESRGFWSELHWHLIYMRRAKKEMYRWGIRRLRKKDPSTEDSGRMIEIKKSIAFEQVRSWEGSVETALSAACNLSDELCAVNIELVCVAYIW